MLIKLTSGDNKEFEIPREALKHSLTLSHMIENLGIPDNELADTSIPIIGVNADILEMVIEFLNRIINVPVVTEEILHQRFTLSPEDEQFLNLDNEILFKLLNAANYLDIPNLINIITQKIANLVDGKCMDKIREIFMLPNDVPEEDLQQLQEKYNWADM